MRSFRTIQTSILGTVALLAAAVPSYAGLVEQPAARTVSESSQLVAEQQHSSNTAQHILERALSGTSTPQWLNHPSTDVFATLLRLKLEETESLDSLIATLPANMSSHYRALFSQYAHYRLLAESGYWCASPASADDQELIEYLLWLQGDLSNGQTALDDATRVCQAHLMSVALDDPRPADPLLQAAIARFQKRNGLPANGEVDHATLLLLQRTPEEIAWQIRDNLNRMADLDTDAAERYIVANVPDYTLTVYESGIPVLEMDTIVGKRSRQTPAFTAELQTVVVNPTWNVPTKIAYRDLIPKQRRDPNYLSARNIQIFEDWQSKDAIDPSSIDWDAARHNFPYRMRQLAGPRNALGQFKFITPNDRAIYLHDTNARVLFTKEQRMFSSGCVRLAEPYKLAEYLLRDNETPVDIEGLLVRGSTKYLRVAQPIPVHYVYWTAWVDETGTLQSRPDIYERDTPMPMPIQVAMAQVR